MQGKVSLGDALNQWRRICQKITITRKLSKIKHFGKLQKKGLLGALQTLENYKERYATLDVKTENVRLSTNLLIFLVKINNLTFYKFSPNVSIFIYFIISFPGDWQRSKDDILNYKAKSQPWSKSYYKWENSCVSTSPSI